MPIRIRLLQWSRGNVAHIARHGLVPDEVEEACFARHFAIRVDDGLYRVIGQSAAGRYITTYLSPRPDDEYYVVTARDANTSERRAFRAAVNR